MKKLAIKTKIILLYTFLIAILIGLNIYIQKVSTERILMTQAERNVISATEEIALQIKIEDDGVYIEENEYEGHFYFYHDAVQFLVYSDSTVAFGQVPNNFDATVAILLYTSQVQEYQGMTWITYDVAVEDGYVLRGIYDVNAMADSLDKITLAAEISALSVIIFTAIGGYLIIKRSFKPIDKIYQTAASIKEEEDYSRRIPTDFAKDEVYELADMVNQMLDKVETSIKREKQFSSNVSHELRTPLTVMQAQAEYLLAKANDATVKEEISSIINQVAFMENIVTQLLEIARSRQIASEEMESIDLFELIKYTSESFSAALDEKQIILTIDDPKASLYVYGHQTMLIRVFSNLIVNAIKYNSFGGRILISFAKSDRRIITRISDTGIGIPQDKIERIFDSFYRVDESRTKNDYSLGLGLALTKEVVKIHGGDILVESEVGKGTTFTVIFPESKK